MCKNNLAARHNDQCCSSYVLIFHNVNFLNILIKQPLMVESVEYTMNQTVLYLDTEACFYTQFRDPRQIWAKEKLPKLKAKVSIG